MPYSHCTIFSAYGRQPFDGHKDIFISYLMPSTLLSRPLAALADPRGCDSCVAQSDALSSELAVSCRATARLASLKLLPTGLVERRKEGSGSSYVRRPDRTEPMFALVDAWRCAYRALFGGDVARLDAVRSDRAKRRSATSAGSRTLVSNPLAPLAESSERRSSAAGTAARTLVDFGRNRRLTSFGPHAASASESTDVEMLRLARVKLAARLPLACVGRPCCSAVGDGGAASVIIHQCLPTHSRRSDPRRPCSHEGSCGGVLPRIMHELAHQRRATVSFDDAAMAAWSRRRLRSTSRTSRGRRTDRYVGVVSLFCPRRGGSAPQRQRRAHDGAPFRMRIMPAAPKPAATWR